MLLHHGSVIQSIQEILCEPLLCAKNCFPNLLNDHVEIELKLVFRI